MKLTTKPHLYTWLSIPLILILSIIGIEHNVDFQMHDTYFVMATIHLGIFYAFIMGIAGFLYWLMRNKKLINWMTLFHLVSCIFIFMLILIIPVVFDKRDAFRIVNQLQFVMIGGLILSQVIFLINLVVSLIRNKKKDAS